MIRTQRNIFYSQPVVSLLYYMPANAVQEMTSII